VSYLTDYPEQNKHNQKILGQRKKISCMDEVKSTEFKP